MSLMAVNRINRKPLPSDLVYINTDCITCILPATVGVDEAEAGQWNVFVDNGPSDYIIRVNEEEMSLIVACCNEPLLQIEAAKPIMTQAAPLPPPTARKPSNV